MALLPYRCFGLCNDFKRHLKTHLLAVLMTSVTQRLGGLSPPANFAYGRNEVCAKPIFQNKEKRCSMCPPREQITDDGALINKRFSAVKGDILIV